ncbi:MAG TPA: phosphatidate cytidylyltransferase [Nitrospiraceae bacterium]|nr:phosphatidate cytidylyltransferase [Nitrospiraceae bacterium]
MEPHISEYRAADHHQTDSASVTARFDLRRVYTAIALAPLIYAVIRYLPSVAFIALAFVIGATALYEFYRLFFHERTNGVLIGIGLLTLANLFVSVYWHGAGMEMLFLGAAAVLIMPLIIHENLQHHLIDSAVTLFGVVYIGGALSHMILIRSLPQGESLALFILFATWAADTGAYFVGKTFGRHPLVPAISPKKTVEGLLGGLAFAIIAVYVCRSWIPSDDVSMAGCVGLGSMLTIAGLIGDLAESALKRSAGVKDSSGLLPGHGGMLDRIDSLLFTAPAFYYYVRYSGIPLYGS